MSSMIGYIVIVAIVIIGVGLVMVVSRPVIEDVKTNLEFREAEDFLMRLDRSVKEVVSEGEGSSRILKSSAGNFRVSSDEGLVEFSQRTSVFDYLVRNTYNGIALISGADSKCYEADMNNDGNADLVMENSYITVVLSKMNGTYDTRNNIILMKSLNTTIIPTDSSIIIDSNPGTALGSGFSLLERTGSELPKCRVRFFMNSSVSYDIFYTLYSGADFVSVEVRNVK